MNYTTNHGNYGVTLDQYDGPIDLLLHLVKKDELPIEKLSLARVTDQYFACLEQLAELDFDLAGEYLVIAATLLSLKSSYLTGDGDSQAILSDIDSLELDPHEELLRRLKEAAVYRESAQILAKSDLLGIDVFSSQPTKHTAVSAIVLKDHDPFSLGKALQKLIDKVKERGQELKITIDTFTIADRMIKIIGTLKELSKSSGGSKVSFESLFENDHSVLSIISSFLAILELCKRNIVSIRQEEWCNQINVWLTDGEISETGVDFGEVDSDMANYL